MTTTNEPVGNFEEVSCTPDFVGKWTVHFYGAGQRRVRIEETLASGPRKPLALYDDVSEAYRIAAEHNRNVNR